MSTEERVQLVRLLATHLGNDDITDRHVVLDHVDKNLLMSAAEGCITELNMTIVAGVAMDGIDCRLVFATEEKNNQIDDLVTRGLAIYMDSVD